MQSVKKGTIECKMHLEADKPFRWYRIYFVSFQDKTGRIVRIVGSAKDISEEKAAEEELEQKLKLDSMTGIMNKFAVQNAVSDFLLISQPTDMHAFFMIDTDNFKAINDNLGHMFGDEVIKFVAKTIQDTFRDTDFVGRLGGDEFMAMMKNTSYEVTVQRAKALNEAMRRTFEKDGISITISCSIGIAFFSKDGADYETLYRNADACMYEAKKKGKDCYVICGE